MVSGPCSMSGEPGVRTRTRPSRSHTAAWLRAIPRAPVSTRPQEALNSSSVGGRPPLEAALVPSVTRPLSISSVMRRATEGRERPVSRAISDRLVAVPVRIISRMWPLVEVEDRRPGVLAMPH